MNRTILLVQKLIFTTPILLLSFNLQAQLQTIDATSNGPYTPQSLISNVFLGAGVDVVSVTYSGSNKAVGYFSGGTQSIGIERGIIMTSGFAAKPAVGFGPADKGQDFATNSNGSLATDINLANIATAGIQDVAVYTITFIPTSDTLRFRYCFASEEYPEYSCTQFNDVFGFFIQGPGYPVPTNIAKVPGTNLPVSINNIHPYNDQNNPSPNPCFPYNAQYYNSNTNTSKQPVYDGFTDVLTAMAVVIPCQQYTIKLAIADVGDSAYDSGVFLEARSFGTTSLRVSVNTPSADGSIAEGCLPASVTFTLSNPTTQNFPINYAMFGNATPGVDYQALPANLTIPAGQTQLTVNIPAMEDNQPESNEDVYMRVKTDACHWDTVHFLIRDNKLLPPAIPDTTVCTPGTPILLNATVPVPTPPPPSFSNNTPIAIPDDYPPVTSSINVAGVQPTKLGPGVVRSVCLNINHTYDDDLDLFLISPGGQVLELSTDNGASGDNYTNTCFTPTATTPINFPGPQAPATAAPFTGDFLPEGAWSDLWDTPNRPTNGTWQLQVTDDFTSFGGSLLNWSITFAPSYEVTYQWAANADISCTDCAVNTVSPMVPTTYSVTATDIYGCTATDDVLVNVADMTASANLVNDISCFGLHDGSAMASTNIGGANTYHWSDANHQTVANATNLAAGSYSVTITNVGGCSATANITLTEPPLLDLNGASQNATCFGISNGTASLQTTGGTAPYNYLWSNGATGTNLNNLAAGSYTVTVTDAHGCTDQTVLAIGQPSAIQLSVGNLKNISCFGGNDGQLAINAQGGITPLAFGWSNGQNTAAINNLAAGTYTMTVTDNNGCTQTVSQTLTQPNDLTAFATQQQVNCFGESTGQLHLDLNGGTPAYLSNWQGPGGFTGTGFDLTNLIAGNYTATITDAHGCQKTLNTSVTEPPAIILQLNAIADTICFGASDGSATVAASGGNGAFSYSWDANNQHTASAQGLSSNEYHVTVTDGKGCTATAKTFVPQKSQLNTFAQPTLPKCHDGADGSAIVTSIFYGISAANLQDFQYQWSTSPAQFNVSAINLKASQTYTVTVTDHDGCSATSSFTMGNPLELVGKIMDSGNVLCNGEATGWASAVADGGAHPYSWYWSNNSSVSDSIGHQLRAGENRVTVTDANGCSDVVTVTIEEPTAIHVHLTPSDVKCFGESSGSVQALASGGKGPYQYVWENGISASNVTNLPAGMINLTVTDANGCPLKDSISVGQPAAPVSGTADMVEPLCFGDHNGQITLEPSGGTPPYRYALDNQAFNGSKIQIGLKAGEYVPKIRDANGCITALAPIEVTQPTQVQVDLGPDIEILLGQDTQLVAQVFNNRGHVHYSWAPADTTWLSCMDCKNPSVYGLEYAYFFNVTVMDSAGCRAQDQVLVSVKKPRKVYVPTAFSPNGDFVNDLLLVHGQSNSTALSFRIYDRWGEMVYEGKNFPFNDENTGWDGTFRGKPMDPGVYVWVLEVEYVDGQKEVFHGDTTLIR